MFFLTAPLDDVFIFLTGSPALEDIAKRNKRQIFAGEVSLGACKYHKSRVFQILNPPPP